MEKLFSQIEKIQEFSINQTLSSALSFYYYFLITFRPDPDLGQDLIHYTNCPQFETHSKFHLLQFQIFWYWKFIQIFFQSFSWLYNLFQGKIIPLGPMRQDTVSTVSIPVPPKYPRSISVIGMDYNQSYNDPWNVPLDESIDPRSHLIHRKGGERKEVPKEQQSKESNTESPTTVPSPFNRFSSLRESVNRGLKSLAPTEGKRSVTINATTGHTISFQLNSISHIDRVSRVIFPLAFLITNFLYWTTYLGDDN